MALQRFRHYRFAPPTPRPRRYGNGDQAQLRDAAVLAVGEQADARTGDRFPPSWRSVRLRIMWDVSTVEHR